jgi:hypothetical protein
MDAQIPQESPQAGYQMFSGGNAAPGDALNEIAADVPRLPPGGIIAKSDQQLDGTTRIVSDGRICYAPMLPQPLLETDNECRLRRAEIWRAARTNADLLQIVAEPLGAKIRMVMAMASVRIRAAAGGKMTKECCRRRQINVGQCFALLLQVMAEVRRCAQIAYCRGMGVAFRLQRCRKAIDIGTTGTPA